VGAELEISTAIYASGMPVDRLLGVIVCGWAGCHPGPRAAGELVGLRWRHANSDAEVFKPPDTRLGERHRRNADPGAMGVRCRLVAETDALGVPQAELSIGRDGGILSLPSVW
jgi:hypothetical protein